MAAREKPKKEPKKRGPPEERLAVEGPWEDAVSKALRKPPASTKKKGRGK